MIGRKGKVFLLFWDNILKILNIWQRSLMLFDSCRGSSKERYDYWACHWKKSMRINNKLVNPGLTVYYQRFVNLASVIKGKWGNSTYWVMNLAHQRQPYLMKATKKEGRTCFLASMFMMFMNGAPDIYQVTTCIHRVWMQLLSQRGVAAAFLAILMGIPS